MKLTPGQTYSQTVTAQIENDVDVLVAGGGTAGVIAAIAAARTGAKVRLLERRNFLGGMLTAGNAGLTLYTVYDKRQAEYRKIVAQLATAPQDVHIVGGITMEITQRLLDSNAALGTAGTAGSYVFPSAEDFKHLLLTMMQESGVELSLHATAVDVIKEANQMKGVIVESKSGRQVYPAKMFVDATGDGDLAAWADVPFMLGLGPDDACAQDGMPLGTMSDMGVMFRMANVDLDALFAHLKQHPDLFAVQTVALMSLTEAQENFQKGEMSCFIVRAGGIGHQVYNSPLPGVVTLCCPLFTGNGLDVNDLTRGELALFDDVRQRVALLQKELPGFENSFLMDMPEIGVRETRHIQGDYVLTIDDIQSRQDFPDTIGRGSHPIDIGPIPDHLKNAPNIDNWYFNIPYRSLIARDIDNLLLAGRCISATREAFGCTRPTVQCMITGQAAGTAAALAAAQNISPRNLDIPAFRQKLSQDGVVL